VAAAREAAALYSIEAEVARMQLAGPPSSRDRSSSTCA
jgi:hypothetical protein